MPGKDELRETVWDELETSGAARFPFPPHGRIPNFSGADSAAERLTTLEWWSATQILKCNPDAPQRTVRERALESGISVLMAAPRLRDERPFVLLDAETIDDPAEAATIGGARDHGEPLLPEDVPPVDAVVSGSVVVDRSGRRIGKGEGYSDLEFAVLLELGLLDPDVPVATTVHPVQLREGPLPLEDHDVALDFMATPETVIRARDRPARPDGIDWSRLDADRLAKMPAIAALRPHDHESNAVS